MISMFMRFCFLSLILASFAQAQSQSCQPLTLSQKKSLSIQSYSVQRSACQYSDYAVETLRTIKAMTGNFSLIVNPQTLQTAVVEASCLSCEGFSADPHSKYRDLISESLTPPFLIENDGLVRMLSDKFFLTVDLCQSSKPIETGLFEKVAQLKRQFPVGISISGGWMNHHSAELNWLMNLESQGKLQLVWINHSLTHPYVRSLKDQDNFLRMPGTDFAQEVLGQEKKMIESGLTPSIYFRFPGLVSDESLMRKLESWGLVALGSDAWIAKDEYPKPGSIILVHGNGNEHAGISMFLAWLDRYNIHGDEFANLIF